MQSLCLLFLAAAATTAAATPTVFGKKISLASPTPLKTVISAIDDFKNKDILVTGTISKVCEKKGCWMTIKTDVEEVRVTFKDYDFFVPITSATQPVRIQGRLSRQEISVADQKHLLEDAGASKAEIEKITAPKPEYTFVASAVEIGS